MTSFPLLRLPYVPLSEILNYFGIFGLIRLSQSSRKSAHLVKQYGRNRYTLSFKIDSKEKKGTVEVKSKNEIRAIQFVPFEHPNWEKSSEELKSRKFLHLLIVQEPKISVPVFTEDCIDTVISAVYQFKEILGFKIDTIRLFHPNPVICKTVTDWMKDQKISEISKFRIEHPEPSELDFVEFIEKVKVTDHLIVLTEMTIMFLILLRVIPKGTVVNASEWTLNDLLTLEFEKLSLRNTKYTNQNLDVLVKKWVTGRFPMLKHLVIGSSEINEKSKVYGVTPQKYIGGTGGKIEWIGDRGYDVTGGIDIRGNDGTRAKLLVNTIHFSLLVVDL